MASIDTSAPALDVHSIRADFPCLDDRFVFFDSVASSLTPRPVVQAMVEYYEQFRANVHRGSYDLSMKASERFEESLAAIASFINAEPAEISLAMNTTHAINLVALSLPLTAGDEIVVSAMEHSSNMLPWLQLVADRDLSIKMYSTGRDDAFDVDAFAELLTPRTKLVALTHITNVTGRVTPVEEIGRLCRDAGIMFLVDAAQSVPHRPVDVKAINCDFLAFSGHKMLGPTGVGVLYMRRELAEELSPAILGGGSLDTSSCRMVPKTLESGRPSENCNFAPLPEKWQAGTPPIAEALGLQAAIEYLQAIGWDAIVAHEQQLSDRLFHGLRELEGVEVHGPTERADRSSIVSFNVAGIAPNEVADRLNRDYHIGVRAGQHCAPAYFWEQYRVSEPDPGSVRASVYVYNTNAEVDRFVGAVQEIAGSASTASCSSSC